MASLDEDDTKTDNLLEEARLKTDVAIAERDALVTEHEAEAIKDSQKKDVTNEEANDDAPVTDKKAEDDAPAAMPPREIISYFLAK